MSTEDVRLLDAATDCLNAAVSGTAYIKSNVVGIIELAKQGADINIKSEHGNTILMGVCNVGDTLLARELVGLGADITVKNENGEDALDISRFRGHHAISDFLERHIALEEQCSSDDREQCISSIMGR